MNFLIKDYVENIDIESVSFIVDYYDKENNLISSRYDLSLEDFEAGILGNFITKEDFIEIINSFKPVKLKTTNHPDWEGVEYFKVERLT